MFGSFKITDVYGIPIKVHITLIIFLPIIALHLAPIFGVQSIFWGMLAAIGLFVSVALHELGHSVVALAKGIRVKDILLLPIGGVAQLTRMPERSKDEMQIAIAGPMVSLVLALFFWAVAHAFTAIGWSQPGLLMFTLAVINLILAIFNLLPSFPMDGGRIFRAWMTPRIGRLAATRIAVRVGRFMAIVFGIFALVNGSLLTVAVAIFIYLAAGAELRMVQMQEAMRRFQGGAFGTRRAEFVWPFDEREEEDMVIVSPPPYEKRRAHRASTFVEETVRKQKELFDDLFKEWAQK